MSSYKNALIIMFVSSLFLGCANKRVNVSHFEDENKYLILGLDSEARGDYNTSHYYFNNLYEVTKELDYKIKEINLLIKLSRFSSAKKQLLETIKVHKTNVTLKKLLITIYLQEQDFDNSLKMALDILNYEKNINNYELVSSIYLLKRDYQNSLKYLEEAYKLNFNEKVLDKIVTTLYIYLEDKDRAISYLESHTKLYGCGEKLCNNLLALYAEKQNIDGLIEVYKRMFKEFSDLNYGKRVIELLIFKKDFKEMEKFLEDGEVDDILLLEIYKLQKKFDEAKKLTMKLYKNTNDIEFLAQSAMFEYEGATNKNDKNVLKSVIKKLREVVSVLDNDVYQNYLGYVLIEHDIDVIDGMKLVRKALTKDSNSAYYLDSLAWGYYKLKDYKNAYKFMKKVVDELGLEDEEVAIHWQEIKNKYKR